MREFSMLCVAIMMANTLNTNLLGADTDDKVRLLVSADSPSFDESEGVSITIKLENNGTNDVRIGKVNPACQFALILKTPSGKAAQLTQFGINFFENVSGIGSGRVLTVLKSGVCWEYKISRLNKLYDMSIPGDYVLVAQVWDLVHKPTLNSNEIKITIKSPKQQLEDIDYNAKVSGEPKPDKVPDKN